MTKKIKKLEKETTQWRTKWESNNQALLQMAEEVTSSVPSLFNGPVPTVLSVFSSQLLTELVFTVWCCRKLCVTATSKPCRGSWSCWSGCAGPCRRRGTTSTPGSASCRSRGPRRPPKARRRPGRTTASRTTRHRRRRPSTELPVRSNRTHQRPTDPPVLWRGATSLQKRRHASSSTTSQSFLFLTSLQVSAQNLGP